MMTNVAITQRLAVLVHVCCVYDACVCQCRMGGISLATSCGLHDLPRGRFGTVIDWVLRPKPFIREVRSLICLLYMLVYAPSSDSPRQWRHHPAFVSPTAATATAIHRASLALC